MGCDCCSKSNYGQDKCSAGRTYRESFCGVLFDNEQERNKEMSPHRTKAIAKRRKKNKNKKTHRK